MSEPLADHAQPSLSAQTLADLTRDGVNGFERVAERLGAVQRGVSTLTASLDELAALCAGDDDGSDPLGETSASLARLQALLAEWRQSAGTPAVSLSIREGANALEAIHRQAVQLGAVASMTAMTASSLGTGKLADYVVALKAMASSLNSGATLVDASMRVIIEAQVRATSDVAEAEAILTDSATTLRAGRVARDEAEMAEKAARETVQQTSLTVRRAAHADMKTLIAAMQFSDAFAQRMDHVGQILALVRERSLAESAREVVLRLAAAQTGAIADDGADTRAEARAALTAMAAMGREALPHFGARESDGAGRALIVAREGALRAVMASLDVVRPSVKAAHDEADRARQAVDSAAERFGELQHTAGAISLSAINATLLTERSGTARAALGVLAGAVRESAQACEKDIRVCKAALGALGAVHDPQRVEQVALAAASFAASVERCADLLLATESQLSRMAEIRTLVGEAVSALVATSDAACAELDAMDALDDALRALAAEIAGAGDADGPADPDQETMAEIFATYTMARERDIHTALFDAETD